MALTRKSSPVVMPAIRHCLCCQTRIEPDGSPYPGNMFCADIDCAATWALCFTNKYPGLARRLIVCAKPPLTLKKTGAQIAQKGRKHGTKTH